jgi:hypothetical protein
VKLSPTNPFDLAIALGTPSLGFSQSFFFALAALLMYMSEKFIPTKRRKSKYESSLLLHEP